MDRIGFVGLGRMGQAMAPRLLDAGYPLTVWNRSVERTRPLIERGAGLAPEPADLTQVCDIVLSMLTDDAAVEQVYCGPGGLLSSDVRDKLFIEMSTIRPDTLRKVAAEARLLGAAVVDSPMSGTVGPAREGKLLALVGGEPADVERARPVLDVLCRRVAHLGPVGSGTTMKLVLNYPMAVYWQALAEALALGQQAGLDLAQMLELIADSPAALGALAMKMPYILGEEREVAFDVRSVRKDLVAMVASGSLLGVPMPSGAAALASFAAATAAGYGDQDLARLVNFVLDQVAATTSPATPQPADTPGR